MANTVALERETALPGARLALILLLVINFFNYVDRQVLASVEALIEKDFFPGADFPREDKEVKARVEFLMGSLNTAFMVSYMLFAPVFGWLADRMGRWLLVAIGVIVWSLASGASGLAETFGILFFTRCLVGVGEAAYGPVAPTVIADMYPVSRRGAKLAWFYMAIPVGSACGYILGGSVSTWMDSWRWPFYVVVLPGLLLGIWCLLMREPPRGSMDVRAGSTKKATWQDYLNLAKIPSFVLNTLGMTAMSFAMGTIAFWMPRYIALERKAGDLGEVNFHFGIIVVVSGLGATLLGGLTGDYLKSRVKGAYFIVSAVAMLLGFPMVIISLYVPFPLAWLFIFLACFCLFFNTGPTNTILANVTHPAVRATAFAVNILIIHAFGDAVSPMILGYINGHYGMNTGFTIVSCMFVVAAACWFWGARHLEEDTRLAPTRM